MGLFLARLGIHAPIPGVSGDSDCLGDRRFDIQSMFVARSRFRHSALRSFCAIVVEAQEVSAPHVARVNVDLSFIEVFLVLSDWHVEDAILHVQGVADFLKVGGSPICGVGIAPRSLVGFFAPRVSHLDELSTIF